MSDATRKKPSTKPSTDLIGDDWIDAYVNDNLKKQEEKKAAEKAAAERLEAIERKRAEEQAARDARAKRPPSSPSSAPAKPAESKADQITFDDVIGLEDAKQEFMEAIILPEKYPSLFEAYGKKPVKGALMYGPPGCGKTLLAKAVASSMASMMGREYREDAFQYLPATNFQSSYVGSTEANIRKAFTQANDFHRTHGYRQVMFIDEADSLLHKRGTNGVNSFMDGFTNQFLTELDGFNALGAFVILATNRPDSLDDAVTRPGRCDRKIHVGRPTHNATEKTFKYYLGKTLCKDADKLAKFALQQITRRDLEFFRLELEDGSKPTLTFWHMRSGAVIDGIVAMAIGKAIFNDLDALKKLDEDRAADSEKYAGVEVEYVGVNDSHIQEAIERTFEQSRDINHQEAIYELTGGKRIINCVKTGGR